MINALMNVDEYVENMAKVQTKIIEFIDNENNVEESYENFKKIISDIQILKDCYKFKSVLRLFSRIAKNHYRKSDFISKIQKILNYLKKEIKQTYSNFEIFNIFKNNKIILLFLIEEKILIFDKTISNIITTDPKYKERKYQEYFFNEIKPFIEEETQKEISKNLNLEIKQYEEKRLCGENDSYICELIRKDSIEEFITYVNKTDLPLSQKIEESIFETNSYILNNRPNLIEYSAFYGSVQIFRYLFLNNAKINDKIWLYAIHGNNPELISFIEDNCNKPNDQTYEKCLEESIKCHQIEVINYILEKYNNDNLNNNNEFDSGVYAYAFHYLNFLYFPKESECYFIFYYACKYNYINIVEHYIKDKKIDINSKVILTCVYFINKIPNKLI